MIRRLILSSAIVAALVAAAPRAWATGERRCEVHVVDASGAAVGDPRTSRSIRADEDVTVLAACTDHIAVFPQQHTRRLTPPDLVVTTATACRAQGGADGWAEPKALPLVEAPDQGRWFTERDASVWAFRGRLPPGRVHVQASRSGGLLVDVEGAAEVPACPPPPPPSTSTWTPPAWTPPPPPPSTTEPPSSPASTRWDDRRGVVWEVGAGPQGFYGKEPGLGFGGVASFGLHWVAPRSASLGGEKSGELLPSVPATRWCVPIACAGLGVLLMPTEVLFGNELGVDLRIGADASAGRAALRPIARASLGTLRTPSLFGFLAPEVGLRSTFGPRGTDLTIGWSLFPVEWRVSGALALGIEPLLATWRIGLDHRGAAGELSAGLSFRVAP